MKRFLTFLVIMTWTSTVWAFPPVMPSVGTSLPTTCSNSQVVVWNSTTGLWDTCANNAGGTTIATDTLWDAAGDTVYATGDNTGARLAKGTAYQLYMMNSGATAPAWTSTLGATGTRLTKGWFTDLEVTNAIAGSITGNAATATALAADPANCAAGQVALGITAAGVAECTATPSVTSVTATTFTGALTGNASTATALAADPADCTNQFARGVNASGVAQCASVAAADITSNTITATQLAATLTFADGDLIDLSGITHSGATDEGLVLPTWANVSPTSDKKFLAADGSNLKLYNGGWVTIGSSGAPTDAQYWVATADATLSAERNLGALTTGLVKNTVTAGVGVPSTAVAGTDYVVPAGNVATATALAANGANCSAGNAPLGVDASGAVEGCWAVSPEAGSTSLVTTGTVTTGTWGATAIANTKGGTGQDSSGWTGLVKVTAGTWAAATAGTDYPGLASANTFTENNVFGNADTDTLTIRSMIIGGNSREVQINAGTRTAPSNPSATPTQDLYVKGNIETPGTIYATGFSTGSGTDTQRRISLASNTSFDCATYPDSVYFVSDVMYFCESTTAKTPMKLQDAQTATAVKTFQAGAYFGDASNNSGVRFYDGSSNYWTVIAPTGMSTNPTFKLPSAQGASGTYLYDTDGAGTLGWGTPSATAAGSDTQVQFNDGGTALGGDSGLTWNKTSNTLTIGANGAGGSIILYNELGATDYNNTIQPNASQSGAAVHTLPTATGTLLSTAAAVTPAQGGTGVANGANNTITFTGNYTLGVTLTGNTTVTLPTSGTLLNSTASGVQTFLTTPSMANLGSMLTDEGTGVITFLTTPSSANFASMLTDESGTGLVALVDGADTTMKNKGTFASPITTNPLTLTAAECKNNVLWYGATGTVNLPAATAGMNLIIYNTGAFTITIDPNGTDVVVRDGTAQTGGVSFTLSSGAGNYVTLVADTANHWVTVGYKGTLAAGS